MIESPITSERARRADSIIRGHLEAQPGGTVFDKMRGYLLAQRDLIERYFDQMPAVDKDRAIRTCNFIDRELAGKPEGGRNVW